MTTYYITSSSASHWIPTKAKTLSGAKALASKEFGFVVGGRLKVAIKLGGGETLRFEPVAVKHGFDRWQDAS